MAPYVPRVAGIRERQLFFGAPGSGKSNALMSIMRRQADDFFYILDSEDDWMFSLGEDEANDELLARGNFDIRVLTDNKDFDQHLETIIKIREKIKPGEFFFYDKLTPAWQAAQDWFTNEIFGEDLADYVLEARKALEEKRKAQQKAGGKGDRTAPVFDQLRDWGPINAQYNKIVREIQKIATVAHVFIVADIKNIGENTKPEKVRLYRPYSGLPAGQGDIDVLPHTIIHFDHDPRAQEYTMSTVKDRGTRESKKRMDSVEWVDFSVSYLRDVAGWHAEGEENGKAKGKGKKK